MDNSAIDTDYYTVFDNCEKTSTESELKSKVITIELDNVQQSKEEKEQSWVSGVLSTKPSFFKS